MVTRAKAGAKAIDALVAEALDILRTFKVPVDDETARRQARIAKAFLAVAGMKPGASWRDVHSNDTGHRLRSRKVISWMNAHLGEAIADSSYDDIRRKDLVWPVEIGIVLKAAERAGAKTNDGTRAYALAPEFAVAIRAYGTPKWAAAAAQVISAQGSRLQSLSRERELMRVPVTIGGKTLSLSPGAHNAIQKAVVEELLPRFGFGADVLYLGDTENKNLFQDRAALDALGFFELAHDKLPDVVAYSKSKNWLFLIEAVDTSNPITELRRAKFIELTHNCKAGLVFVTAFADRATFRKFAKDIAWETEVWIADNPDHMIHFNGDKFLGPYR